MTKTEAIKHFGSQSALARALSITQPSVAEWAEDLPALRQIQIERVTGGQLRADPSCYEPSPQKDSEQRNAA